MLSPKACPHAVKLYYNITLGLGTNVCFSLNTLKKKKSTFKLRALDSAMQDVLSLLGYLSLQHMVSAESLRDWQPAAASAGRGGPEST